MIKIELNEKELRNGKMQVTGTVKVKGDNDVVMHEMYAILKEFEENATEAFMDALDLVMQDFFDKMKGEDE